MQINVLPPSHPAVMTMMSFPEIPQEARMWVSNQLAAGAERLTDFSQQFLKKATEAFKHFHDGSLDRAARNIARTVKGVLHPNTIVALNTIQEVQAAKPIMQRYIMACPNIREIYFKQLCDGYSDSYVDFDPGCIGEDHYDFRRVMQGIVKEVKIEGSEEMSWVATMYLDELRAGDRELEAEEQFMILEAWEVVKDAIRQKIDPTDIFNGDLGI